MEWKNCFTHVSQYFNTRTTFLKAIVLSGYQFLCSDVTELLRLHTPSRSDVVFHLVIVKLLTGQMITEMQKQLRTL